MSAEFLVQQCYDLGGEGVVVIGAVERGDILEGSMGRTFKGKKFTLVKIEKEGFKLRRAHRKDKVSLFVKYIKKTDVRPGEILRFD